MAIKTRTRYVIMSSDYSQQEPKVLAQLTGDNNMLDAYRQGKDLYSQIAAIAFHSTYEKCLEHFPKGTPIKQNKETGYWEFGTKEDHDKYADGVTDTYHDGKERRSQAKKILLGIMYGRGENSIAEQLGCDVEEARKIKDDVYSGFPAIKNFEEDSIRMVHEKGYVTTLWGRKRRLPNFNLPEYEIKYYDPKTNTYSPVEDYYRDEWLRKIYSAKYFKQRQQIIQDLEKKHGIKIFSNSSKIADAQRQIINSRVQGCLDGNTRIQSKEYGFIQLQDYVNQTLTIWDGNEWTPGTIVASGKKQKCIIHFIGGQTFICSPEHKFDTIMTNSNHKWRSCKDLKHGMHININHNYMASDYQYSSDPFKLTTIPPDNTNRFEAGRIIGRLALNDSFGVRKNDDASNIFMDTELLRGFISGFYDSNGMVNNAIILTFGKQSDFMPMLIDLQKALLFYGIRSNIVEYTDCYRLGIKRNDCKKFANTIGFLNIYKQQKAEQITTIKDEHRFGPSLCVDYVEITNDFIEMYDICDTNNGYFIADGLVTHNSAGDMSKKAMIAVANNEELRELGGRLLVPIHDELLLEAPLINSIKAREVFAHAMETAAEDRLTIPIKCDVTSSYAWYGDELDLQKEIDEVS